MDKYRVLINQLSESKETLENRKNKKNDKLSKLRVENDIIVRKKQRLYKKIEDQYNIKKCIEELGLSITAWCRNSLKVKRTIFVYGIVMIVSILTTLGLYFLVPSLIPILNISIISITAISSITALIVTLKPSIAFLKSYYKNRKVVANNNLDDVNKKIKKYEKQSLDLDKTYERNELKINNVSEKIEILEKAIKDLNNLIDMVQYERTKTLDLELDCNKDYTEEQETSILNYCFNNSDAIKRIRRKEREIKNDN